MIGHAGSPIRAAAIKREWGRRAMAALFLILFSCAGRLYPDMRAGAVVRNRLCYIKLRFDEKYNLYFLRDCITHFE
ncbi:hypothetical protein [Gluconacetobacter asukensis]|uniref:Uncharacterized protein n=2 Tax=Gluconacetobacter asukensis TaxID=1017181 RepID=A0A7W4P0U4_9PROT|nr:hypothetical protein [Gluconacetobacter asukensis]MBB2173054.1 hypothetical protein [Gluconacetobacter asukensis]